MLRLELLDDDLALRRQLTIYGNVGLAESARTERLDDFVSALQQSIHRGLTCTMVYSGAS
jgi:hypothetical protein